jgi:anaerobic ribonucleoside-triphosphate reductase activating protein
VLVDGEFVLEKKNISLRFRGSENQRIIDLPRTRAQGSVMLWEG